MEEINHVMHASFFIIIIMRNADTVPGTGASKCKNIYDDPRDRLERMI